MTGLRWLCLATAAAQRMVPLPQLPPQTQDLEAWLRSHIHPTTRDDGWAAYQRKVLAWCAPFWRPEIVSAYDVLLDRDLWDAWRRGPPRFGRFVFVLLPWHHIVELHGFRRHAPGLDYAPLRAAAALLGKLSPDYPHVIILGQADLRQILVIERRHGATPLSDALRTIDVRFTTRLEGLDRVLQGKAPDPRDIALPLLFRAAREVNASRGERARRVFFRGSCTSKLRNRLARALDATASLAVDVGRCGQGGKARYAEFVEGLRSSLFVLAPRGSYPASFMLSEAVQAGALPVFVYEAHLVRGRRLGGPRKGGGFRRAPGANASVLTHARIEAQLPYANLGLKWSSIGAVATGAEIVGLLERLGALSAAAVRRKLDRVAWARPLFTSNGARLYVELVLSALASQGARRPYYDD